MTEDQSVNQEEIKNEDNLEDKKEDPSDKLTPDHPRFKDVLNRAKAAEERADKIEKQMADLQEQITKRQEKTGDEEFTPEEIAAYNKIQKLNKQAGFITKEELENERLIERQAEQLTRLEKQHDGTDGLPKFDSVDVQIYAKKNGFSDLEKAYRDMHFDALVQHELKNKNKVEVPESEKPGGGGEKQIGSSKFTPTDISNMSDEEYEQNRDKILGSLKPKI